MKSHAVKPRRVRARKPPPARQDVVSERPDHAALIELQRSVGNRAVTAMLQRAPEDCIPGPSGGIRDPGLIAFARSSELTTAAVQREATALDPAAEAARLKALSDQAEYGNRRAAALVGLPTLEDQQGTSLKDELGNALSDEHQEAIRAAISIGEFPTLQDEPILAGEKDKRITMTGSGSRTEVMTTKRNFGGHSTTTEVTDGDAVHTTTDTSGRSGLGLESSSTDEVNLSADGESASRNTSSSSRIGVGLEGAKIEHNASTATTVVDKDGNTVKGGSATGASFTAGPSGLGAEASKSATSSTGAETKVNAGGSVDFKGNYEAKAGVGVASGDGVGGATASVGKGHHVTAGEPVEVSSGVWEVAFTVDDSDSVNAGLSGKGGGASVGIQGGDSSSTLHIGTKRFSSEKEALAFQKDPNTTTDFDPFASDGRSLMTPADVLSIPIGESRGLGDANTHTAGVSGSLEGATLGWGVNSTEGHALTVRRVGEKKVQVTRTVSTDRGSDWTLSTLGFSDESGSTASHLYEVTYEFDLDADQGRQEYVTFCQLGLPPSSAHLTSVHEQTAQEDHDKYKILGTSDTYTGKTTQDTTTTDQGTTTKFTGQQGRDASAGSILKFLGLGDDIHTNAQIVRTDKNGEDAGGRAELDVSGTSGAANRAEFAKIFGAEGSSADATASGKWTLTADVPMAAIRELEAISPRLRYAPTMDEKMKIYSELVKENGAQMLGGQVGMTSTAWDLELKGDENFPGEKGRQRLNDIAQQLRAQLKAKPAAAGEVRNQAEDELRALGRRRTAVADEKKYTDLPAGLRKEQLAVIDHHISDFSGIRRSAQSAEIRSSGTEGDIPDPVYTNARDQMAAYEGTIGALRKQVRDDSKAIGDVIGRRGSAALRKGVDPGEAEYAVDLATALIARATDADKQQAALDPQIAAARDAWTTANDPKDRLTHLKALNDVYALRVKLTRDCVENIHLAALTMAPVTTSTAMSGHPDFWRSLGVDPSVQ